MMCTDTIGASMLCEVTRMTIWLWRQSGLLGQVRLGGKTFIPIRDIAKKMNTTQKQVIAIAEREGIPLWQVK